MSTLESRLYRACRRCDKHLAQSLLTNNRISNSIKKNWITTPLHEACKHGWLDVVRLLIEKCCYRPDLIDRVGCSPLHYACRYGGVDLVKYLTSLGSNPVLRDVEGFVPLDYALQSDQLYIACYLCQKYISSEEMLANDRNKTNIILIRKLLQYNQDLIELKIANGDTVLEVLCHSKAIISHMSSEHVTILLKSVTITDKWDTIPHLICHTQSYVACVPTLVVLEWLTDTKFDLNQLISSCDWKTMDGDALIQLVCQSQSYVSRISSNSLSIMLENTKLDLSKVVKPNYETSNHDSILQLVCQSESCVSRLSSTLMKVWLTLTTVDLFLTGLEWKTADGITMFDIVSNLNKSKTEQHLSDNSPINAIITYRWEASSSLTVLFQSELYISHVTSTTLLKWLSMTSLDLERIIVSNWKTADGDTLLQLVCQSKSCLSRISSKVIKIWLSQTNVDLFIANPDWMTADGDTLYKIACQLESKLLKDSRFLSTIADAIIVIPYWGTIDSSIICLEVIFLSEWYISCLSSAECLKLLSNTTLDLETIIVPNWKTADGDTVFELVCNSGSCLSRISSCVIAWWFKNTTLDQNRMFMIPNWSSCKTANGDIPLEIVCKSKACVSCIPSMVFLKWFNNHTLDVMTVVFDPNYITADNETLLELMFRSDSCLARVSSKVLEMWLSQTKNDFLISHLHRSTSDHVTIISILCRLQSKSLASNLLLGDICHSPYAMIASQWETVFGCSCLHVLFRTKEYMLLQSSAKLLQWFSKTTLDLEYIVVPNWRTADGSTLLELLCKSESCISRISSTKMLSWLINTEVDLVKLITPNWKTSDGKTLLQLVSTSSSCLSRISSSVIQCWVRTTTVDLLIYLEDLFSKTADDVCMISIVKKVESRISKYLTKFLNYSFIIITPHWDTGDKILELKVLYHSEEFVSLLSSLELSK